MFVAAFVPRPGVSAQEEFQTGGFQLAPGFDPDRTEDDLGRSRLDPEKAAAALFHDLDPDAARAAAARLRPQAQRPQREPHPLQAWPAVPSYFIHCARDRSHTLEFDDSHARERLGVGLLELDSGHSPFLSTPRELAAMLDGLERRVQSRLTRTGMAVDLAIDVENTPGALARVAAAISDAGVNIAAATCIGSGERAELHILVPRAGAARHSLAISHVAVTREREVVVVDVEDHPGVLADLTRKIARAGVNLDLVYVATRNRVVFGADDISALRAALNATS